MRNIEDVDIIVFEKILQKEKQKFFCAKLFNANHTQILSIEFPIQMTGVNAHLSTKKTQGDTGET